MKFRTEVAIPSLGFTVEPCDEMLFVGSCFADEMGRRFRDDKFRATVNPFGVMYNPASILHTVCRAAASSPRVAVLTLGTNHVYILNETGEIVDNCQKRPQRLFTERELSVEECEGYLRDAVVELRRHRQDVRVIVTVSPIRYAKYGFHGSRLSKAVLLLAADRLCRDMPDTVSYFPAYEIMNDELRDYRFHAPDMLHPTEQAADYIYERLTEAVFSPETRKFTAEWRKIRAALAHRPFDAFSPEYQAFISRTREQAKELQRRYPRLQLDF